MVKDQVDGAQDLQRDRSIPEEKGISSKSPFTAARLIGLARPMRRE